MPCGHKPQGRNLIVCIDGTLNQFGEKVCRCGRFTGTSLICALLGKNTNVVELYNLVIKEGEGQKTWYNSGIGTYARPSWKSLKYYARVIYNYIDPILAWCVHWFIVADRALVMHFLFTGTLTKQFRVLIAGSPTTTSQEIIYFCLVCEHNSYRVTSVLIRRNTKVFLAAHFRSGCCQR
jgi:hypothetical protein